MLLHIHVCNRYQRSTYLAEGTKVYLDSAIMLEPRYPQGFSQITHSKSTKWPLGQKEGTVLHICWFCHLDSVPGIAGGSVVKNPPVKQQIWVQSLRQEDPLEKEMATHSSILAWEIPRSEEPGGLQSTGLQTVGHDLVTKHQQYP